MDITQIVDYGQQQIPIIDISMLVTGCGDRNHVGFEIGQACRKYGFFYIVGHGVGVQNPYTPTPLHPLSTDNLCA